MQRSTIIHAAAVLVAPALVVLLHTPARADVPRCQGLAATVDGVVGTAGDDVIVGSNLSEDVQGLGGDDVICGRGGSDLLMGGDGNDRLYGQRGRDLLDGGSGDDVMRAGIGPSGHFRPDPGDDLWAAWSETVYLNYQTATRGYAVDVDAGTATGEGHDRLALHGAQVVLYGTEYDDTLLGTPGDDLILGDGGTDTVSGRGGDDWVSATSGTVSGGDGSDRVQNAWYPAGESTPATLLGGDGDDRLYSAGGGTGQGGRGDDDVRLTLAYNATLTSGLAIDGGEGHDTLRMTDESDGVFGHVSYDLSTGDFQGDAVSVSLSGFEAFVASPPQDDSTSPLSTSYDVTGTDGPDEIYVVGTRGSVVIDAGGGDDSLLSGAGDDTLAGGAGTDRAGARDGTDTCMSIEVPTSCEVLEP